jgi:hypothetical protein
MEDIAREWGMRKKIEKIVWQFAMRSTAPSIECIFSKNTHVHA